MMAKEKQVLCVFAAVVICVLAFIFYHIRKSSSPATARTPERTAPVGVPARPSAESLGELLAAVSSDSAGASAVGQITGTPLQGAAVEEMKLADSIARKPAETIPLKPVDVSPAAGSKSPGPVEPAKPAPAAVTTHTVEKAESLISISKKYYGNTSGWQDILKANSKLISSPMDLRPGMKLEIPNAKPAPSTAKTSAPAAPAGAAPAAAHGAAPAAAPATASVKHHTVVKGDTLFGIAAQYYKSSSRWRDILKANPTVLSRAEDLRPGMNLVIP